MKVPSLRYSCLFSRTQRTASMTINQSQQYRVLHVYFVHVDFSSLNVPRFHSNRRYVYGIRFTMHIVNSGKSLSRRGALNRCIKKSVTTLTRTDNEPVAIRSLITESKINLSIGLKTFFERVISTMMDENAHWVDKQCLSESSFDSILLVVVINRRSLSVWKWLLLPSAVSRSY